MTAGKKFTKKRLGRQQKTHRNPQPWPSSRTIMMKIGQGYTSRGLLELRFNAHHSFVYALVWQRNIWLEEGLLSRFAFRLNLPGYCLMSALPSDRQVLLGPVLDLLLILWFVRHIQRTEAHSRG